MEVRNVMEDLIREFNNSFEGDAQIVIHDGTLEITVLSRTLIITLPEAIGWQATPESYSPLDTHKHKLNSHLPHQARHHSRV